MRLTGLIATIVLTAGLPALATDCPKMVKATAEKAHAGAKMLSCHAEHDDDVDLYEMKLKTADGKDLELEIGADGAIIATEERIAPAKIPAAVTKSIEGKFGGVSVSESSRVTTAAGEVAYEIAFTSKAHLYSMTVKEDGTIVETEDHDSDHDTDDEE
jgi:hypothetical protein